MNRQQIKAGERYRTAEGDEVEVLGFLDKGTNDDHGEIVVRLINWTPNPEVNGQVKVWSVGGLLDSGFEPVPRGSVATLTITLHLVRNDRPAMLESVLKERIVLALAPHHDRVKVVSAVHTTTRTS